MIVVRMVPGSGWDPAVGSRGQRLWDEHAAFMDDLFARGLVELAGPLADGTGALSVVRSDSVDEVRSWFEADPWTVHDVLPVADVREWTIFLDGRSGPGRDDITPGWRFLHIGVEGDGVELDGVRLWGAPWVSTGARITVSHPQYPDQRHVMSTYQTSASANPVEFAAGEFSDGVWGFFVPEGSTG